MKDELLVQRTARQFDGYMTSCSHILHWWGCMYSRTYAHLLLAPVTVLSSMCTMNKCAYRTKHVIRSGWRINGRASCWLFFSHPHRVALTLVQLLGGVAFTRYFYGLAGYWKSAWALSIKFGSTRWPSLKSPRGFPKGSEILTAVNYSYDARPCSTRPWQSFWRTES